MSTSSMQSLLQKQQSLDTNPVILSKTETTYLIDSEVNTGIWDDTKNVWQIATI